MTDKPAQQAAAAAAAIGDAEDAAIQQELLALLAKQGRRVPYPVGLAAAMIAFMAADGIGWWLPELWLAGVVAVLALRWWLLGRLPLMAQRSLAQRVHWAVGLSGLNGAMFALSLGFTPFLGDYERMVQTILLLGLCAGSVATTAGHRNILLAFVAPVSLASALSWASGGGGAHDVTWLELTLGLLIIAFGAILMGLGRDAWRVFVDSIHIRMQQQRSNEQLRVALQRAESAIDAKTRFFASASHDLRQPMHTLSLLGSALLKRQLDPSSNELARQMNVALRSLATQMDALLDISKLDAQVIQVKPDVFSLSSWLRRLHQEFQPSAQAKGLTLMLECPPGAHVETDPVLLERVVRNLIDNAIKYTQQGTVELKVERDDELWRLSVLDSGVGIAPAEQARVFEEFYQVGNPERDRAKGLGLGLSIVSRLVDLLDLSLALESQPGVGSCFTLSITAVDPVQPQLPAEAPDLQLLQGLRVLVVDDEEPVRVAMQALLSSYGCEVLTAGGTREAMVVALSKRPDIVLADLRLRGSDDGLATVRSLRSALPDLPAVLISGDTAPERLREAHAAGLLLLHKPVDTDQLLSAIAFSIRESRDATASTRPQA